jgi:hypothetical protein
MTTIRSYTSRLREFELSNIRFASAESVRLSDEFKMLLKVLIHNRKAGTAEKADACASDLADVLIALRALGYCCVPCGVIDSVKLSLTKYGSDDDDRLNAAKEALSRFGSKP